MDGLFVISILVIGGFILSATKKQKSTSGMNDNPVSLENIRRGVANGWYSATLTMVGDKFAIRLSGKTQNGQTYTDVYPISQIDWETLKAEGYNVA